MRPEDFRTRMGEALATNDAGELCRIAREEAAARGNADVHWFFHHLGKIASARITDDPEIRTAAISRRGGRYTVRFDRSFLERFVRTPACLLHLLMHELGHKIRGDLHRPAIQRGRRKEMTTFLVNVAADILLEADLRRTAFPDPPPYLGEFRRNGNLIGNLLSPPEVLLDRSHEEFGRLPVGERRERLRGKMEDGIGLSRKTFKSRDYLTGSLTRPPVHQFRLAKMRDSADDLRRVADRAVALYETGWLENPSFDAFLAALIGLLTDITRLDGIDIGELLLWEHEIPLIGNHGDDETVSWEEWVEQNGVPRGFWGNRSGRGGDADRKRAERAENEAVEKRRREVADAVAKAMAPDPSHPVLREALLPSQGILPFPGRREAMMIAGGYQPLFYPNPVVQRDRDELQVHLYLDVSGSMEDQLPFFFELLAGLKETISYPIHGFSNDVFPLSLDDLRSGEYWTTGGTDFDCIAAHALEHRYRRIMVITDGYADFHDGSLRDALARSVELFAVVTDDRNSNLLDLIGRDKEGVRWWNLDPSRE